MEAGGTGTLGQQVIVDQWRVLGGPGVSLQEAGKGSHGLLELVSWNWSLKIKLILAHCCKIREHRKLFLKRKYNP